MRRALRIAVSAEPWLATAFLASYLVVGPLLFGASLAVLVTALALSLITVGLPLLVGAAAIVRGCAQVERTRARLVTDRISQSYQRVEQPGLVAQIRTRWSDRATRRDVIYLVGMFPALLVFDLIGVVFFVVTLAGLTLPFWFWLIPQNWDNGQSGNGIMIGYLPQGPHTTFAGPGFGIWVGDLSTALITAAVFVPLVLLGALAVVGTARVHTKVLRYLLGPYADPLAAAKEFLHRPDLTTAA
jgi:Putative sensor